MFLKDVDFKMRGFMDSDAKDKANINLSKATQLLISLLEANTTTEIAEELSESLEMNFLR